jgi:hypothetical protein
MKMDEKTKAKIQKLLATGLHPNTPEAEAKVAMSMAAKLLSRFGMSVGDFDPTDRDNKPGTFYTKSDLNHDWEPMVAQFIGKPLLVEILVVASPDETLIYFAGTMKNLEFVQVLTQDVFRFIKENMVKKYKDFSDQRKYAFGIIQTVKNRMEMLYRERMNVNRQESKARAEDMAVMILENAVGKRVLNEMFDQENIIEQDVDVDTDNRAFYQGLKDGKNAPLERRIR